MGRRKLVLQLVSTTYTCSLLVCDSCNNGSKLCSTPFWRSGLVAMTQKRLREQTEA